MTNPVSPQDPAGFVPLSPEELRAAAQQLVREELTRRKAAEVEEQRGMSPLSYVSTTERAPTGLASFTAQSEHARAVALLHEVWTAIHVRRHDKSQGKASGPYSYYGGIQTAAGEVLRIAAKHGISEQEVYRG